MFTVTHTHTRTPPLLPVLSIHQSIYQSDMNHEEVHAAEQKAGYRCLYDCVSAQTQIWNKTGSEAHQEAFVLKAVISDVENLSSLWFSPVRL